MPEDTATDRGTDPHNPTEDTSHGIGFGEAFWTWVKISLLSFGGPAGQIAMMHQILVEEKSGSARTGSCMP